MQVTETKSEGLKREYSLTVTAADLEAKTNEKLEGLRKDFHMKGFRKGKAPLTLIKQHFGKSVLGEVVQETVESSVTEHLESSGHRPARQPDIKIANDAFDEGDDLTVEIAYECLPDVPDLDYGAIALERKTVAVDEAQIDEALGRLAESAVDYEEKDGAAEANDQVLIDFLGKIDGTPFDGGEAEDYPLVLGSNSFIPGFEDQLIGKAAGEEAEVEVNFPEDYGAPNLAGKTAVFDVTVKQVRAPQPSAIDDGLAQRFGAENLDDLKDKLRTQIGQEFADASRNLAKRRLLDVLDDMMDFDLPESLVEVEAKSIAHQLWHEENPDVEGHDHPEIEPTEEHVRLAERRVKLGLLLAELGRAKEIEVTEAEMTQAMIEQARQYPGQERAFFEYVQKNPGLQQQIRAPLFEDKVVDYIFEVAEVEEKEADTETLKAAVDALEEE